MKLKKLILSAALVVALPSAFAEYIYLDVPLTTQKHSEWCWAAVAKSIANYHWQAAEQCDIVNWARGINYACYGGDNFWWDSPANKPNELWGSNGTLQTILWNKNVGTTPLGYALGWGDLVWDIQHKRPVILRYQWRKGGGHVLIARGYQDYNGVKSVFLVNSWPGEGYGQFKYDWVVSSDVHYWSHTMRMDQTVR